MNTGISMQELRVIAPRVALYVGIAYLSIRGVRMGINQASRWLGMNDSTKSV